MRRGSPVAANERLVREADRVRPRDPRRAASMFLEASVAHLMTGLGLAARRKRRRKHTTRQGRARWRAPDLINRDFGTDRVNHKWYGDGTEIVTGEGRLDRSSFEGKVVGGVLEWAADAGVPRSSVIVGQATDDARDEVAVLAGVDLLVLTDRVWQAGETFARAALLVEEAATETARRALTQS